MSNITTLSTGLETAGQYPLNGKRVFLTLASMIDLGANNLLAFKYMELMEVVCMENKKTYVWREAESNEQGEIAQNFTYPNGAIAYGIDYSNREFNFFEIEQGGSSVNQNNKIRVIDVEKPLLDPEFPPMTDEQAVVFYVNNLTTPLVVSEDENIVFNVYQEEPQAS